MVIYDTSNPEVWVCLGMVKSNQIYNVWECLMPPIYLIIWYVYKYRTENDMGFPLTKLSSWYIVDIILGDPL